MSQVNNPLFARLLVLMHRYAGGCHRDPRAGAALIRSAPRAGCGEPPMTRALPGDGSFTGQATFLGRLGMDGSTGSGRRAARLSALAVVLFAAECRPGGRRRTLLAPT